MKQSKIHRVRPGYYLRNEGSGSALHVFRYAGKWHYVRNNFIIPFASNTSLFLSFPYYPGFPTYRMALSAAAGNRKS